MQNITTYNNLIKKGINRMQISRLIKKNQMQSIGYNLYTHGSNILILQKDKTTKIINKLLDNFPISPKRVIFSSSSLNFCINQIISNTTYIVEVEKEYIEAVFNKLKKQFTNNVLLKPTNKEKINYWKPGIIYVNELFTRSPINKDGMIRIEKLIFDLIFDVNLYSLYSGKDIESAIDILCKNYAINFETLFAYAKRKNKEIALYKTIVKYIPEEIKNIIKNDK